MKFNVHLILTQRELDAARGFFERNGFNIPEGMADDVRQTGPASQTFYVAARNTDGDILGMAKIGPHDVGAEPAGPVKIEAVYPEQNREIRIPHPQFLQGILSVCSDRKVPGIVVGGDESWLFD